MVNLNTLSIKYHSYWPQLDSHCFEVFIDDKPLNQIIADFEQHYGCELEGGYRPSLLSYDIINNMLKTSTDHNDALSPLICDCGDLDCCFVECQVKIDTELVYWHNWRFDYRDLSLRDDDFNCDEYHNFPSLVFEKQAYVMELNKVQKLAMKDR